MQVTLDKFLQDPNKYAAIFGFGQEDFSGLAGDIQNQITPGQVPSASPQESVPEENPAYANEPMMNPGFSSVQILGALRYIYDEFMRFINETLEKTKQDVLQ